MSTLIKITNDEVIAERVRNLMLGLIGSHEIGGEIKCRQAINNYKAQLRQKVSQL